MARNPLPRSNFGTASLVERRDSLPPVALDEGNEAEVVIEGDAVIEAPGLSIELEDDWSGRGFRPTVHGPRIRGLLRQPC